ncbi:von Willebrand factor A domain-containing protein 5A-like isoform X2 [Takifugu flavidus]|uniref:von Willebrand factor A domain-containing protein 5A-like isoform X2 n=1 Tax=Takifugu flavidus TaxID=433684 RepID=UPI002544700B|nr:von Willebrand factor A domain-containing protein 5A-like isoform X2 [Takifugu flavidus]
MILFSRPKMSCCGLVTINKEPVPLKSVGVDVEVRDHVASVVSTLNYENSEDKAVEAVFVFPLPGDAAVCHFSATVGQKEIVAEVKEKQQAHEEYDDALSSGQQAFLLEESDETPDIFSLRVGSLPPGQSASIRLEYVIELAVEADDGLRFCLPAVLNPRYQPEGSKSSSVQVSSVAASEVPYTLSLCVRVSSTHPVSKVESNCSLDPLQYLNTEKTQTTVKLAPGHKFDRDVELLIYYQDAHQPTALVEAGKNSAKPSSLMADPVVMLSLYPEFPKAVMSSFASCGEFVFLMDCSGSMSSPLNRSKTNETCIASARDTLLLLLKSLPMGCYFNIYTFGSSFEHIFPKSVEYTQKTMDEALKKVKTIDANLGGTEILRPLQHIFSQTCIPNQPRQVFVFTDGEVCNTKEVISLVKKNSASHRCFSFGIGEGSSSALINGLAKEGGGHAQFITGSDRMQPKVMQSLKFALQPAVMNVSLVWDLPKEVSAAVLSPPITSIFQGQRSLVYARLTGLSSKAAEGHVTLNYSLAGQPYQNKLHFCLKPTEDNRLTVHRLAARTLIRSLEMEGEVGDKNVKEEVVEVSVQSGVSSSFTAFIGVNKDAGEVIQGPLLLRNISTLRQMMYGGMPLMGCCSASYQVCMPGISPRMASGFGMRKPRGSIADQILRRCSPMVASDPGDGMLREDDIPDPPPQDLLLQLVSLQKASGCWALDSHLADALGKTIDELRKAKPEATGNNKMEDEVWATILALIWLHGEKMDAEDEWSLLAQKALSWLQATNAPYSTKCVDVGNSLLGSKVKKEDLGL